MRAELLRCFALGVDEERHEYERVPILPSATVSKMVLSTNDSQLPAPAGQVTLHGVSSWLRSARDVQNDQRVVIKPPLLEALVNYALASAVEVKARLSPRKG